MSKPMSGYKNENVVSVKGGKLFNPRCDSDGCNERGSYGYKTPTGQFYFCLAHKNEGEILLAGRKA